MPTNRPRPCRTCGAVNGPDTWVSRRGYCPPCGEAALAAAHRSMIERRGPHYDRWRAAMVAAARRFVRTHG